MKRIIIIISALLVVLAVVLTAVFLPRNVVRINKTEAAAARFRYGSTYFDGELKPEDAEAVRKIFNGKLLYKDTPSCGFTENVSVKFGGGQTFCIANDMCGIIYLKEKDKYFHISQQDRERLNSILEAYGFIFPCV